MADAIAHRGPDSDGYWQDTAAGVALAHLRLAIIDLTPAGAQPMVSASGRFALTYNGEIYNFQDLRRELEESGKAPHWRGHSDTEVFLACVEAWGVEEALQRAYGMFALALWDAKTRRLILARDRLGEKPLYYARTRSGIVFGSELRALKAHPGFDASIDRDAVALLLRYNYIPAPHSIYAGVHKLPAGTWLDIGQPDETLPAPQAYWSLHAVAEAGSRNPLDIGEDEAVDRLDGLLREVVRSQMVSDVPLGAFLSGGVDSSAVVAAMQMESASPVRSYSIGFDDARLNEADDAAAVARHLGTEHTELYVTEQDALATVPGLPDVYDEPFADSSQIPTLLLSRLTRQHVTVAMSGDGGDEMFGGYNRYLAGPRLWNRFALLPSPLRQNLCRLIAGAAGHNSSFAGSALAGLLRRSGYAPGLAQKMGKIIGDVGRARTFDEFFALLVSEWNEAPALVPGAKAPQTLLDRPGEWPDLNEPEARMMALDALTYLPDDIMVKVDRSSMSTALETRAPYLDARIVEFANRLPLDMKISGGSGKKILRKVLYRYVPPAMIERPKQGFAVPLDDWLRNALREWAEDLLSEDRLREQGFLDPEPVRTAWQQHLSGARQFSHRLWSVLMFQAWLEH